MSARRDGQPLWWVRRLDGTGAHLFCGSHAEMVAYIAGLHRDTGIQHAAREVE